MHRYNRQTLLPQIGQAGQARLRDSRVLLIGCGALGGHLAEQLVRSGVGHLRLVDRDIVEWSNLQRQVLFDEQDAREGLPKAIAAVTRLKKINSEVEIDPIVADVHAGNIEELCHLDPSLRIQDSALRTQLLLDGTDNVQTRYLINDVAVKHSIPWIYGACVGTEGRMMPILPGVTPCLRCIFSEPPSAGELPTCDTAGVLGPAAAVVAAMQAAAAIKILTGNLPAITHELTQVDLWSHRFRSISVEDGRRSDCIACGQRQFEFLADRSAELATALCGRNAVQIRPPASSPIDLKSLAQRLSSAGEIDQTRYLLKCRLREDQTIQLTVFPDARALIHGTSDPARARSIYARYVGG
jgi:adenylyltransferase/sulfurtransferase